MENASVLNHNSEILLRAEEVAARLRLGRSTVYDMIKSGQLPSLRVGRSVRVPLQALTEWVASRTEVGGDTAVL